MAQKQEKSEVIIAERLIINGSATAAELSERAAVSRPTVIKALKPLLDSGVIIKNGVRYGFFGGCAAVFFKVNKNGGQIVGYRLGEREIARVDFKFSQMLSYIDNLTLYIKKAEGYLDFLKKDFRKVFCCFIYDGEQSPSAYTPDFFDMKLCRDGILSDYFLRYYGDKLCVFLDRGTSEAVIFDKGSTVRKITVDDRKTVSVVENIFEILSPDALVLDGMADDDSTEALAKLCRQNKAEFVNSKGREGLSLCEREALIRLISRAK